MTKPESETDPWKAIQRYEFVQTNFAYTTDHEMERDAEGEWARWEAVDAARAAEAAQHRQFKEAVATALCVENEHGPVSEESIVEAADSTLSQLFDFSARLAAVAAERDRLKAALQDVTTGMDRAGGDRDGMPECPWCQSQGDYDHSGDCALVAARAALTPQGQSTDGETR